MTRVVLPACLLATSCGTATKEDDIVAVSDRFHAAIASRDGTAACAELSVNAVETLERQEKRPCREAVLELDLPAGARASGAQVYVTSGYAALTGSNVVFVDEGPAGWKVAAAGCTPSSPDHPYDCELGG